MAHQLPNERDTGQRHDGTRRHDLLGNIANVGVEFNAHGRGSHGSINCADESYYGATPAQGLEAKKHREKHRVGAALSPGQSVRKSRMPVQIISLAPYRSFPDLRRLKHGSRSLESTPYSSTFWLQLQKPTG
jgi:hypothetical protein